MRVIRRRLLVLAALLCALGVVLPAQGAPREPGAKRYIVVFKDSVSDPATLAVEHSRKYGARFDTLYGNALKGYAGEIPSNRIAAIRADVRVAYVEEDMEVQALAQALPWGIDYVDADVSSTLAGNGSGAVGGVNVYVIDTGIGSHPDLNVVRHVNFAKGRNADCNGHGTHVAGTVGARDNSADVVGVAPGVSLYGVKVLNCNGSGTTSGVIKGIDWVTADHDAGELAVANMSLGGGASSALDQAVRNSAADGVVYAVAAGNSGANACNSSPARAGAGTNNGIITVAAIDSTGAEASWSNYGPCVDIWAPGVSILSTRLGGGTTTFSGTSMASPHTAGTAALYLSTHAGESPSGVEAALRSDARSTGRSSKDGRSIFSVFAGLY